MRIATLNTWKNEGDYPRRLGLIAEGLAELSSDVVCLQECFVGAGQDTAAALARRLGLALHAAPGRTRLRPHAGRIVESSSGLATLLRPAGLSRTLALPTDPADGERIAQIVDLMACGRPLRVLNLHLTHLRGSAASLLRGEQLRQALTWACSDLRGALVVAGDFNATAHSPELERLGLAATPSTLQSARWGGGPREGLAIDHCLLMRPGGWEVSKRCTALDRPQRPHGRRARYRTYSR